MDTGLAVWSFGVTSMDQPVPIAPCTFHGGAFRLSRLRTLVVLLIVASGLLSGCAALRRTSRDDPVLTSRQLSLRGMDAVHQGRWDDAESLFKSAIALHPGDERAHRQYAELLWRRGERELAIREMQESLKLSGGDPEVRVQLGAMYLERGDLHQAWAQAEEALAVHRQLVSAWALRGDVLNRLGQPDESLVSYHRALSYQPHAESVQLAIAEIYRSQNKPQRALATLQLLEEQYGTEPPPPRVLLLQGLALKSLQRYDEAIHVLSLACRRNGSDAESLFHLAECHWLSGDLANAGLAVQAALASNPTHEPSRRLHVDIQASQKHLTAGLQPFHTGS